ncbi:MAG TPA: TonB-dependent receptor [Terriglobia bacterium]|nr:TonB-dependent receptor [Terriglobia bacterium]
MGYRRLALLCFLVLLSGALMVGTGPAYGQTGLASISGTVHDASGAVVPGVTVTAINTATNVSYRTATNSSGAYYIGALPIGSYTLTGLKQGFKQWQRSLQLEVSQNASIDFRLDVGNTRTVLQVTGAPPILDTTGTEVSHVLDAQRINMLPLNGRSITSLFQFTPGVEGGSNPRANGMRAGATGISLDGVTERSRYGGGIVNVQPDIQDVQEFIIDTSGSNARYADPSSVIMKTKSGTNRYHGELFETNRNDTGGLRALARGEGQDYKFPKYNRNEFGGNIGGPLQIPLLYNGHNKTFFFFSYEGLRDVGRESPWSPYVPTEAMWNGDLSSYLDPNNNDQLVQVYNPFTTDASGNRQPFAGNIIPPSAAPGGTFNNLVKVLKPLTAVALTQAPLDPYNPVPNFNYDYPTSTVDNKLTAKIDEALSPKDRLSVRWSRDTDDYLQAGGLYGNPNPADSGNAFGTSVRNYRVTNVGVEYARTLSSNQLNELTVGVLHTPNHEGTSADSTDWADNLGFPNPFGATGWPTFYESDLFGWDADNPQHQNLTSVAIADNYTWIKGKHTIQLGGSFGWEDNNITTIQQAQGSHNFGLDWTCQWDGINQCSPDTGSGFASLLLGLPDYLSVQFNHGYFYFRQKNLGLYISDKWRVTPRLTLSLGVRWDKFTPYSEKYGNITAPPLETILNSFQTVTPGPITDIPNIPPGVLPSWSARGLQYVTASQIGYPHNLFAADNNNFGPRLGAAFKINDKTVVRGAYGIYYWPMPLQQILGAARGNPPLNLRFENDYLGPGPCGYGTNHNYTISSAPTAANILGSGANVCTNGIVQISDNAQGTQAFDFLNWKNDKAQNWNITLERELPFQTTLTLNYTGNRMTDLDSRYSLNNPLPQITYIAQTGQAPPSNSALLRPNPDWAFTYGVADQSGYGNANSAQINVEHKYRNGITAQWFWVWTRDLSSNDTGNGTYANVNSGGSGSLVPENRVILGEPNLSRTQLQRLVYYNSTSIPAQHYGWNTVMDLPFGRGKKFLGSAHGALDQLVGGWQVSFNGAWTNGYWMSIDQSQVVTGNPTLDSSQRIGLMYNGAPELMWFAGNINPSSATNVEGGSSALSAVVSPDIATRKVRPFGPNCSGGYTGQIAKTLADGTCYNASSSDFFHTTPKASILGPSAFSMDGAMYKNFKIRERAKVRFEADFFNLFNHPTNNYPDSSTGLIYMGTQANTPRLLQFSLHLIF